MKNSIASQVSSEECLATILPGMYDSEAESSVLSKAQANSLRRAIKAAHKQSHS